MKMKFGDWGFIEEMMAFLWDLFCNNSGIYFLGSLTLKVEFIKRKLGLQPNDNHSHNELLLMTIQMFSHLVYRIFLKTTKCSLLKLKNFISATPSYIGIESANQIHKDYLFVMLNTWREYNDQNT